MRVPPLIAKRVRSALIVLMGTVVSLVLVRLAEAGVLSPTFVPTVSTMQSIEDTYDAITSDSYDSSLITADKNGNAFEISRCIINQLTGGTCP
jgi:hypothetical protein